MELEGTTTGNVSFALRWVPHDAPSEHAAVPGCCSVCVSEMLDDDDDDKGNVDASHSHAKDAKQSARRFQLQESGARALTFLMCVDVAVLACLLLVGTLDLVFRIERATRAVDYLDQVSRGHPSSVCRGTMCRNG